MAHDSSWHLQDEADFTCHEIAGLQLMVMGELIVFGRCMLETSEFEVSLPAKCFQERLEEDLKSIKI